MPVLLEARLQLEYDIFPLLLKILNWRIEGGFSTINLFNFVTVLALVLCALGIYARLSLVAAGLLMAITEWAVSSNLRTNAPNSPILVIFLLVLCGVAFREKTENLRSNQHDRFGQAGTLASSTCLAIEAVLPFAFLNAAISKVIGGGFGWLNGETLSAYFHFIYLESGVTAAKVISSSPNLCLWLSVLTLAFEIGFAAVIFVKKWRPVFVGAALIFHLGVLYTMWINFLWMYGPIYFIYLNLPPAYFQWRRV